MGPRVGLDRGGKSRPHRDSIPDLPARSSVAILTELPRPTPVLVLPVLLTPMGLPSTSVLNAIQVCKV